MFPVGAAKATNAAFPSIQHQSRYLRHAQLPLVARAIVPLTGAD
jgi:hypothetical protein